MHVDASNPGPLNADAAGTPSPPTQAQQQRTARRWFALTMVCCASLFPASMPRTEWFYDMVAFSRLAFSVILENAYIHPIEVLVWSIVSLSPLAWLGLLKASHKRDVEAEIPIEVLACFTVLLYLFLGLTSRIVPWMAIFFLPCAQLLLVLWTLVGTCALASSLRSGRLDLIAQSIYSLAVPQAIWCFLLSLVALGWV